MNNRLKLLSTKVNNGTMTRREFMGKAAALGVTAAVASTMLADAAYAAGAVKGGTFKLGVGGGESTNSQDPATWASDAPLAGGYIWGETLVYPTAAGLDAKVAESWEGSADAKTWRFKVRQGITFSNGAAVTADDVLATMKRHSNEDSKSGALGIMKSIESMRTDGDVFELTLAIGNADLPYLMADYHLIIQPNGGFDDPTAAIGTGLYTLETDEPGVRMTFKKNPNHWAADEMGHYDDVELIILNDATARTAALQSGQVDSINRVEPKIAKLLGRAPNIEVKTTSGRGHYVFIAHVDTAPFDNNELRLALKHAMNRHFRVRLMQQRCSNSRAKRQVSHWKSSVNQTMVTGQKYGTFSHIAHLIGVAVRFKTRCIPQHICPQQTGTIPVGNVLNLTQCFLKHVLNWTKANAKRSIPKWAVC